MKALEVEIAGIGAWAPGLEGWAPMESALAGRAAVASSSNRARPSPVLLPSAERRRAPDGVAVALEVANEAVCCAVRNGVDGMTLASVFASAHGDLSIVDYLCSTVATDPAGLSPTRFHLSVHNAAAGYWSIAMRDMAATTALAGGDDSFALGLLEATTLAIAERRPVLLVAFDTPAVGLLAHAVRNTALFGFALVVRPASDRSDSLQRLSIAVESDGRVDPLLPRNPAFHAITSANPAARALALAESIASSSGAVLRYPIGSGTSLSIDVAEVAQVPRARRSMG
jgi:hypothetical protein